MVFTKEEKISYQSVTVLSQKSCQPCRATERWLTKRGVDHEVIDLADSPEDAAAARDLGHQQTPVVLINYGPGNDVHFSGYRPDLLAEHINIKGDK